MKTIVAAALLLFAICGHASAQQIGQGPSSDDLRAAIDAAIGQRDRALSDLLESAVMVKRLVAAAEAQKATLIEWLRAAQANEATAPAR